MPEGDERWLVAPSGERNWVKNARAATRSSCVAAGIGSGTASRSSIPAQAVPVLRRYYELGRVTRPFFDVTPGSTDEEWLAEAPRHPVFELLPVA